MSGYQIRQTIDQSIGNFWTESYGQIYPTLKKLTTEGLVSMKAEAGEGPAERKVYRLTSAGEERLRDWLNLPAQQRVPRNELLLKLFFSGRVPVEIAVRQIEAFRALQQQRITRYAAIASETERRHAGHPHLQYWLATVSYGNHDARAQLAWCDETLTMLAEMPKVKRLRVVKNANR